MPYAPSGSNRNRRRRRRRRRRGRRGIKQSISRDANRPCSKKITTALKKLKAEFSCSQQPATAPCLQSHESGPNPNIPYLYEQFLDLIVLKIHFRYDIPI
jgi:hypothetical protein